MNVVADASVFIALSAIDELPLLPALFPAGILVPDAVWKEVVEAGGDRPGARQLAQATWVQVRRTTRIDLVRLLQTNLDDGEAEAIALAFASLCPSITRGGGVISALSAYRRRNVKTTKSGTTTC